MDGDDVFQLNDSYFLWAYVSGVFEEEYTHINGNTYQQWSSIDNLNGNNPQDAYGYYQTLRGGDTKQRREFTVFWDNNLDQETAELESDAGGVAWFNPDLMNKVPTAQDTLNVSIGAGPSTFDDPDITTDGDVNPDYTNNEIAYYFTGDMNLTGTKVKNAATSTTNPDDEDADDFPDVDDTNTAVYDTQATSVSTYYRWDTHRTKRKFR